MVGTIGNMHGVHHTGRFTITTFRGGALRDVSHGAAQPYVQPYVQPYPQPYPDSELAESARAIFPSSFFSHPRSAAQLDVDSYPHAHKYACPFVES